MRRSLASRSQGLDKVEPLLTQIAQDESGRRWRESYLQSARGLPAVEVELKAIEARLRAGTVPMR